MNMRKYILSFMILGMAIGCQTKEDIDIAADEVRIDALYPSSVATKVADNRFETGDRIGFYMVQHVEGQVPLLQYAGNYATNIQAMYDGTAWTCVPKVFWENGVYDFYAYYPYMADPNSVEELDFQVQLDQSGNGYTLSDFMWAKSLSVTASESAVPLLFSHRLSRMNIVFEKGEDYTGELPENADVYIHNTNPYAVIDLNTGDAVCNSRFPAKTIKARRISASDYEAIIVPQRISNRVPLIEIVVDNISYMVESKFLFKAGMSHTYKVILSDNPDKVEIEIGGGIENWN